MRRFPPRNRQGFTLIEVMIAMVLLVTVVMGLSMSSTMLSRAVANSSGRARAQSIADMQVSRALMWPSYGTLSTLTTATYNPTADGFTMGTTVALDTLSGRNRTVVTVTVQSSVAGQLAVPVRRQITIAAP